MSQASSPRDPTRRFSDRVENYVKYRPGYPDGIYDLLTHNAGLHPDDRIADLGSGTGLLSRLFLEHGHAVLAVEPNAPMRTAAEQAFADQPLFISVDGRAEATTLEPQSIDFLVAGQAFHWFEPEAAKAEGQRILKPSHCAALIWNRRDTSQPFQRAYEELLDEFGIDFHQVDQRRITDEAIADFFLPHPVQKSRLRNYQTFDLTGLQGRLLSSSYAPTPDYPTYKTMLAALENLFSQYEKAGHVQFDYWTEIYYGRLS